MVGKRIRQMREEVGLSQRQLAQTLCVSVQAVCRWENGSLNPSRQTLAFISAVYGVDLEWLQTGEGEMFSELDVASKQEEELLTLYRSLDDERRNDLWTLLKYFQ